MTEAYDGRQDVGMDLHRRRSVLVRMTGDGRKLETVRIENSPQALRAVLARAGKNPRVVAGATYGWYWAVDVPGEAGAEVHLAHPLGVKAFTYRRVKDDERDAADLADLLRMGRLPEARGRAAGDPGAARAHQVPAQAGRAPHLLPGPGARRAGQARRPGHPFGHLRRARAGVAGRLAPAAAVRGQGRLAAAAERRAEHRDHSAGGRSSATCWPGTRDTVRSGRCRASARCQSRPAGIGDIRRFPGPGQLCSWGGLTPRHRESDLKVSRGHLTKQGSRMLRWAVCEAIQRQPAGTRPRQVKDGIIARRGTQAKNTAKVAAARELLTLVFYSMRDGHIRRADRPGQAA